MKNLIIPDSTKSVGWLLTLALTLGLILFLNTGYRFKETDPAVIKQKLKLDYEVMGADGQQSHMIFWAKLFYVGNYMVVAVPTVDENAFVPANNENEVLSEMLTKTDTTYNYHVLAVGDKNNIGLKYKDLDSVSGSSYKIDSMLNLYTRPNFPYFDASNDTLVSRKTARNSNVEVHRPLRKIDSSYPDFMYYYFDSKLSKKGYCFSKFLDSTRKSKVSKVMYIYNPTEGNMSSGRKMTFELTEYPVPESSKILALIERYKTQMLNK